MLLDDLHGQCKLIVLQALFEACDDSPFSALLTKFRVLEKAQKQRTLAVLDKNDGEGVIIESSLAAYHQTHAQAVCSLLNLESVINDVGDLQTDAR